MSDSIDYGNLLNDFISLTGSNEEEALNWLDISNYQLQTAIELYFSNHHQPSSSSNANQQKQSNKISLQDDDYVREPDTVKRQRLVSDIAFLGYN